MINIGIKWTKPNFTNECNRIIANLEDEVVDKVNLEIVDWVMKMLVQLWREVKMEGKIKIEQELKKNDKHKSL